MSDLQDRENTLRFIILIGILSFLRILPMKGRGIARRPGTAFRSELTKLQAELTFRFGKAMGFAASARRH
jgi:hypothetical protein